MDHDFVRQVYVASYRRLVGQLYGVCGDLGRAEKTVQEAFVRAIQRERQFRRTDNPEAWLRRVAVDLSRSRWRHRIVGEPPWMAGGTDGHPDLSPDHLALVATMQQLQEAQRQVIALLCLGDLPGYEVAEAVDAPIGSVRTELSRGRSALNALWTEREEDPWRELADLLDPEVGRVASEAANGPDFALIEERGRDRARRTRTMTVGAVVAVVAAGVLATALTARDDGGPERADQLREFEGPDDELAEAIESGEVDPVHRMPSADGHAVLTTWKYFDYEVAVLDPLRATNYGVTLTIDGERHWSDLAVGTIYRIEALDDGFLLLWDNRTEFVNEEGVRPVHFRGAPARLGDPEFDGARPLLLSNGRYYAVESADATAALVPELDEAGPGRCGDRVVRTSDGALWAVERDGEQLVRHEPDGSKTSYRYATRAPDAATVVERDGQVGVAWVAAGGDLRVSVHDAEADEIATFDYPDVGGCGFDAAVLPDGRLLVSGPADTVRSLDDTWNAADPLPLVPSAAEHGLVEAGDYLCAGLSSRVGGFQLPVHDILTCTTDGERWQQVGLAD
jgi:RNA polymerase sigma-70 factor (ECF subfamily)